MKITFTYLQTRWPIYCTLHLPTFTAASSNYCTFLNTLHPFMPSPDLEPFVAPLPIYNILTHFPKLWGIYCKLSHLMNFDSFSALFLFNALKHILTIFTALWPIFTALWPIFTALSTIYCTLCMCNISCMLIHFLYCNISLLHSYICTAIWPTFWTSQKAWLCTGHCLIYNILTHFPIHYPSYNAYIHWLFWGCWVVELLGCWVIGLSTC